MSILCQCTQSMYECKNAKWLRSVIKRRKNNLIKCMMDIAICWPFAFIIRTLRKFMHWHIYNLVQFDGIINSVLNEGKTFFFSPENCLYWFVVTKFVDGRDIIQFKILVQISGKFNFAQQNRKHFQFAKYVDIMLKIVFSVFVSSKKLQTLWNHFC